MALSLYTPSQGSIIPRNGDLGGDFWADRAVAHPTILLVPRIVEELNSLKPGIGGPYVAPPPAVAAAMYAKSWRVDAELFGSGVTGGYSNHIETGSVTKWKDLIKSGSFCSGGFFEEGPSGEDLPNNWLQLSFSISTDNVYYSWANNEWWPGLSIFLQTRDFELDGLQFTTAILGGSGEIDGAEADVEVSFLGETFSLYYSGSVNGPLSGSISFTPDEYLDVE